MNEVRAVTVAFDGISKAFGAVQVLHGVSFELALTVFSDPHCIFGLGSR